MPTPPDSNDLAIGARGRLDLEEVTLDVLREAFESGAPELVEGAVNAALEALMSGAIAHPLAAVLAGVTRVLVTAIFDKTRTIAEQLGKIIDEPLRTAVTGLNEVMSVRAVEPEERREVQRRLAVVYDRLQIAYTYEEKGGSNCILIRWYQALAAAMTTGGRPFMELYLGDLRNAAQRLEQRATDLEREADQRYRSREEQERNWGSAQQELQDIGRRQKQAEEFPMEVKSPAWDLYGGPEAERALTEMQAESDEAVAQYEKAESFRRAADHIKVFCEFAATLADNQAEVMSADKRDWIAQVWQSMNFSTTQGEEQ